MVRLGKPDPVCDQNRLQALIGALLGVESDHFMEFAASGVELLRCAEIQFRFGEPAAG